METKGNANNRECPFRVVSCRDAVNLECPFSTRKLPRKSPTSEAAKRQLETSCRVPGHGLHGRKCIAVAADSAAKIKNTKPGPLAITVTMMSPKPYPTGRSRPGSSGLSDLTVALRASFVSCLPNSLVGSRRE
jgi:hypothetical protein